MKNIKCLDCGTLIWNGSVRCRSCSSKGFKNANKLDKIALSYAMTPKELLYKLYITDNMTQTEIAKMLNLTSIYFHLKKLGIVKTGKWQRAKGEASYGWLSPQGYRCVCVNGVEMFEHRYVMERHLGRSLTAEEVVHHKNKILTDNHTENLKLMTKSTHTIFHNTDKCRKKII